MLPIEHDQNAADIAARDPLPAYLRTLSLLQSLSSPLRRANFTISVSYLGIEMKTSTKGTTFKRKRLEK